MGWPERHPDLARYYPTSVLITGFDIIFFWVARMVFSGIHFMGQVPFKDVYIHALVRDEQGQKMSKTKGNVVDPLDMISRYGVDAFRYTLVSMAAQGRDILWSEKRVDSNLKFQNKIWQAFRFAAMHLEHYGPGLPRSLSPYDHWIRARLGETIRRVRGAMDQYRFNEAATELYAFIWDELCDWYVELSKGTLYSEDPALEPARQGARHTLWEVWHALIRLSHPIMPFLTDALWSHLPGTSGELMKAPYPRPGDFPDDAAALIEVAALQETIVALRRLKADMGLSPKVELSLRCAEPAMLQRHAAALRDLARIVDIRPGSREGVCATAVAAGQSLYVPLDGVIDVAAERERLQKELDKVQKDRDSLLRRLETPGFKDRAPAAVVADFEAKLAAAAEKVGKLEGALSALS
jgi:valyl-tRNA synthetase